MLISELVIKSGYSKDTIRYYEKIGLIQVTKHDRYENGYKNYSLQICERLLQISELKKAGFTLKEIADLLRSFENPASSCAELPTKLDHKIALIEEKIRSLENYKSTLVKIKSLCSGDCDNTNGLPECIGS